MMLGRYLARGLAGQQDIVQARTWLEKALAQGLTGVQGDLAALPPAEVGAGPDAALPAGAAPAAAMAPEKASRAPSRAPAGRREAT